MALTDTVSTRMAVALKSKDAADQVIAACNNAIGGGGAGINAAEVNTSISTAGAGTLTAAALVGGLITRTGPSAAYTDTTAIPSLIAAAVTGFVAGVTWEVKIKNMVNFPATIAGGVGMTVSGLTVIPPLSVGTFLITGTSTSAMTMVGIEMANLVNLPPARYVTDATGTQTADAGDLTGGNYVVWRNTAAGAVALTVRTAAQMFGDIPNCQIGFTYMLMIVSQGNNTVTLTADSGVTVTLTGTMTIATKTCRTFVVTFTSATAATITSIDSGGTIE